MPKFINEEDKEFGEYFAGDERMLPSSNPDKLERNTPEESKLIHRINWHTRGSPLKGEYAEKIKSLIQNNEYSDIFFEPKTTYVYRGMFLSRESYESNFERLKDQQNFTFKPKTYNNDSTDTQSTSWSKDLKVAKSFSGTSFEGDKSSQSIIMVAKISDNPNKFRDLSQWYEQVDDTYKRESEVVGFGEIFVKKLILNNIPRIVNTPAF